MLVTFKSGLQITASRIGFQTAGVDDDVEVLVYFNGIQDVSSIPDPKVDLINLSPFISNDSKDPHVITMFVIVYHDLIKSITDEGGA